MNDKSPKFSDPMPNTLEEICAELDFWELHLNDGEVNSDHWVKAKERIEGLRHRENRFRSASSVTYNAIGPNSRINQGSVDQSANRVDQGIKSADWERLAEKFSDPCRFLRADSQWTSDTRADVWRIAGGDNGMCVALLEMAGAMLLKSPKVRAQLSEAVASETDNMSRWLLFLKENGCFQPSFFGFEDLEDGKKITHVMSSTRDLPGDSARFCIRFAALEA